MTTNRVARLVKRPHGEIDPGIFAIADEPVTEPKDGSSPAGNRLSVFMRVGTYVYWVEYSGTKVSFAQFKDTFMQSAARIILKAPAAGGTGTGSSTTGTSSATTTTIGSV
jgi:hypothetical protein